MKINIVTSTGNYELTLDANANIREFRTRIAAKLDLPLTSFSIANMEDSNGNVLAAIYDDDDADQELISFIRARADNPLLEIEELNVFPVRNIRSGHYKPTPHNPKGYSVELGTETSPDNPFFQAILHPQHEHSFRNRLERIGVDPYGEYIPKEFLDPISFEIMNNPVITPTLHTYDLSLLEQCNFVDPNTREQLSRDELKYNLRLRSEIESFVCHKEEDAAEKNIKYKLDFLCDDEQLNSMLKTVCSIRRLIHFFSEEKKSLYQYLVDLANTDAAGMRKAQVIVGHLQNKLFDQVRAELAVPRNWMDPFTETTGSKLWRFIEYKSHTDDSLGNFCKL